MLIQNDQEDFDTDKLCLIDRSEDKSIVTVYLEENNTVRTVVFTGIAAQQVWSQVTEHANF